MASVTAAANAELARARANDQLLEQDVVAQRILVEAATETAQSAYQVAVEAAEVATNAAKKALETAEVAEQAQREAAEAAEAAKQAQREAAEATEAAKQAQSAADKAAEAEQHSAQRLSKLQDRATASKLELKAALKSVELDEEKRRRQEIEAQIAALTAELNASDAKTSALARELDDSKRALEASPSETGPPAQRRRTMQSAPGLAAGLRAPSSSGAATPAGAGAASAGTQGQRLQVVVGAAVTPPAATSPVAPVPTDPAPTTTLSGAKEAFRIYYREETDFGADGHTVERIEQIENLEVDRDDGRVEAGDHLTLTYYSTMDSTLYQLRSTLEYERSSF